MMTLGDLELDGVRPRVAVSFTDVDSRRDVLAARQAGVAIGEIRIDLFARLTPDYVALQAERLAILPTIATVRLASEGGAWSRPEPERRSLFEAALPHVQAVDIELASEETLASVGAKARKAGLRVIASHHDFEGTPPYDLLEEVARRAVDAGADIVKIATLVSRLADVDVLARLLSERPAPNLVVIGMGELGAPTRLAFPARGSLFTFAANGNRLSAPGQLSYERTLKILAELSGAGESS